jgi:serine/threonine-protein kinase RsbW
LNNDRLRVNITEADNPIVELSGEVDFHNAKSIRQATEQLISQKRFSFTIDVSGLEFIDSSGLSALLDAAKEARDNGGEIRLKSPGSQLMHVLTIAGFAPYFSITPKNGARRKSSTKAAAKTGTAWQVTQFEIPPDTELIAEVRSKVETFAKALPFTHQDMEDIKLAVGEATSNALRYGCPHSSNTITIRCSHDGHSLRVQVKDNGPCFDLDAIEPPPIDALDEGGRGIYFMRILMDEVSYFFSHEGTIVELVKHASEAN